MHALSFAVLSLQIKESYICLSVTCTKLLELFSLHCSSLYHTKRRTVVSEVGLHKITILVLEAFRSDLETMK